MTCRNNCDSSNNFFFLSSTLHLFEKRRIYSQENSCIFYFNIKIILLLLVLPMTIANIFAILFTENVSPSSRTYPISAFLVLRKLHPPVAGKTLLQEALGMVVGSEKPAKGQSGLAAIENRIDRWSDTHVRFKDARPFGAYLAVILTVVLMDPVRTILYRRVAWPDASASRHCVRLFT